MGITAKDEVGWGLLQRMKWGGDYCKGWSGVGITAKDEVGWGLLQRMKWGGDYCKG